MEDDQEQPAEASTGYGSVGEMLRHEREEQSLSLTDIAEKTRIPMRHLKALEASDHDALPAITYEIGFAKSYARALGMDEDHVAQQLREEIGHEPRHAGTRDQDNFQPADPARTPPRMLAWTAALIAILLVAGYGVWRGFFWSGEVEDPYLEAQMAQQGAQQDKAAPAPNAAPTAPSANGQVVLTATQEVWVRIYDANNDTLLLKTMAPGERYEVPQQADMPMINLGRPEAMTVTVAGQEVAPLGPPATAIRDIGISAAALLARGDSASGPAV